MKATEILELIRAGYTKEEISAMAGDEAAAPAGTQEEISAMAGDEAAAPAGTQEEQPAAPAREPSAQEPSQIEQLVKAFGLKLDGLTKAIQSNNIHSVEGSTPQPNDVDTIIAKIINPHYGEKEG